MMCSNVALFLLRRNPRWRTRNDRNMCSPMHHCRSASMNINHNNSVRDKTWKSKSRGQKNPKQNRSARRVSERPEATHEMDTYLTYWSYCLETRPATLVSDRTIGASHMGSGWFIELFFRYNRLSFRQRRIVDLCRWDRQTDRVALYVFTSITRTRCSFFN